MNWSSIVAYIQAHPKTATVVVFYVWSAFIGSLPAPGINSSAFYGFFFKFMNTLGANLSRAYSANLPVSRAQARGVSEAQASSKFFSGLVGGGQGASIKPPYPPAPRNVQK
jgi:hypothetical protein